MMGARPTRLARLFWQRTAFQIVLGLALLAGGCTAKTEPGRESFVGKWKSSRLATPLELHENGDWEIKTGDGSVLQYGVWQLEGRRMIWTIKLNGSVRQEANAILSVGQRQFELRELDGAVTRFDRLD